MNSKELIELLNKRYAVKKFNIEKSKDIAKYEEDIKEILRLTPTSFGLQAQKFVIVKDLEFRKKLKKFSWNQSQITDSYMIIVFCVPSDFDESYVERYSNLLQKTRGLDDEIKKVREDFVKQKLFVESNSKLLGEKEEWLTRELHIALGNILTSLAVLGIDSCPIGGFEHDKYDEILGLKEKKMKSKIVLALGTRAKDDKYQYEKKVRFGKDYLFEEV